MPEVKRKITGFGQAVFIAFALVVDGVEMVLDLFVVGVIANRIIDIVVAIIFFIYAFAKGLTFTEDWKVYASIIGTIVGEFIPGLDIAPFFTLDAWYITHSIKAKDKASQTAADEEYRAGLAEQERQEWIVNYQAQQAEQAQEKNVMKTQRQEAHEQEPQKPETVWQDTGGVGRITPSRARVSTNPPPTGKPANSNGIIR